MPKLRISIKLSPVLEGNELLSHLQLALLDVPLDQGETGVVEEVAQLLQGGVLGPVLVSQAAHSPQLHLVYAWDILDCFVLLQLRTPPPKTTKINNFPNQPFR